MANEYASLAQLKTWLQLDGADHDDDLNRVLTSASRAIDRYCGRIFYDSGSAAAKTFLADDPYELDVPDFHTVTGLVIATDTDSDGTFETTWTTADYQVEPLNPDAGWPWWRIVAIDDETFPLSARRATTRVTARWGWAAEPEEVEQTTLAVAAEMFKRKDAPFGIVGTDEMGRAVRVAAHYRPLLAAVDDFRRFDIRAV